jgi:hypothetical protein
MKNFHAIKNNIQERKTKPTEQKKIYLKNICSKRLACRMYKEHNQLKNIKTSNPIFKYLKNLNLQYSKKDANNQ